MKNRSIESILQDINAISDGYAEKTAQEDAGDGGDAPEKTASSVDAAREDLSSSITQLLESQDQTKQASQQAQESSNAANQLEKIANDMAAADMQATIKEAHLFGAAVFDGFLARANSFAPQQAVKQASQESSSQDRIKEAAEIGYASMGELLNGVSQQEKIAHGTEEDGMMDALTKLAADAESCFVRGRAHMMNLNERLQ